MREEYSFHVSVGESDISEFADGSCIDGYCGRESAELFYAVHFGGRENLQLARERTFGSGRTPFDIATLRTLERIGLLHKGGPAPAAFKDFFLQRAREIHNALPEGEALNSYGINLDLVVRGLETTSLPPSLRPNP